MLFRSYPFISGDSFSYVLKISSEPNQAKLVNSNENISIRTYHVQYKMQDDNVFELNKLQNKVNTNYYTDLSMNGYSDTNQISINMENIIPNSEIGL